MKLIIDIDETTYDRLKQIYNPEIGMLSPTYEAVVNGTPLPKGHGRLIDADEIQFENNEFDTYSDYSRAFDAIDGAETIIEADKAERSE